MHRGILAKAISQVKKVSGHCSSVCFKSLFRKNRLRCKSDDAQGLGMMMLTFTIHETCNLLTVGVPAAAP